MEEATIVAIVICIFEALLLILCGLCQLCCSFFLVCIACGYCELFIGFVSTAISIISEYNSNKTSQESLDLQRTELEMNSRDNFDRFIQDCFVNNEKMEIFRKIMGKREYEYDSFLFQNVLVLSKNFKEIDKFPLSEILTSDVLENDGINGLFIRCFELFENLYDKMKIIEETSTTPLNTSRINAVKPTFQSMIRRNDVEGKGYYFHLEVIKSILWRKLGYCGIKDIFRTVVRYKFKFTELRKSFGIEEENDLEEKAWEELVEEWCTKRLGINQINYDTLKRDDYELIFCAGVATLPDSELSYPRPIFIFASNDNEKVLGRIQTDGSSIRSLLVFSSVDSTSFSLFCGSNKTCLIYEKKVENNDLDSIELKNPSLVVKKVDVAKEEVNYHGVKVIVMLEKVNSPEKRIIVGLGNGTVSILEPVWCKV